MVVFAIVTVHIVMNDNAIATQLVL